MEILSDCYGDTGRIMFLFGKELSNCQGGPQAHTLVLHAAIFNSWSPG